MRRDIRSRMRLLSSVPPTPARQHPTRQPSQAASASQADITPRCRLDRNRGHRAAIRAISNTILLAPSRPYSGETTPNQGSLWEERVELFQPFYELCCRGIRSPSTRLRAGHPEAPEQFCGPRRLRVALLPAPRAAGADADILGTAEGAVRPAVRDGLPNFATNSRTRLRWHWPSTRTPGSKKPRPGSPCTHPTRPMQNGT
jgi:hypothetical protein